MEERDFESAIRRARLADITVSTLAVGEEVNAEFLSRIPHATGGRYCRVQNIQEIPSLLFEDRKQIARSSFALDLLAIFGPQRARAGEVTGMSLFTPKPGKPIQYRNQYEDPLLMTVRRDQQFTILFLSDLCGTYMSRFFFRPAGEPGIPDGPRCGVAPPPGHGSPSRGLPRAVPGWIVFHDPGSGYHPPDKALRLLAGPARRRN
jgi:hypothetical protein